MVAKARGFFYLNLVPLKKFEFNAMPNTMRKVFRTLVISLSIIGCSGATKLTISYIQEGLQPHKFNKIAVLALANSDPNRLVIEEAVANQFRASGINSIMTFNLFPLAARRDVLADMELKPEEIKDYIKQKVTENNIDALVIISLLDVRSVDRYVQNSPNASMYYNPMYPAYGYHYYDYYWYSYNTTQYTGYYTTETTYFLETNLYDTTTEELLWTGQTKTENMSSIEAEAPRFAKLIVDDIIAKKVVILQ
jgi:hypothetical protein